MQLFGLMFSIQLKIHTGGMKTPIILTFLSKVN